MESADAALVTDEALSAWLLLRGGVVQFTAGGRLFRVVHEPALPARFYLQVFVSSFFEDGRSAWTGLSENTLEKLFTSLRAELSARFEPDHLWLFLRYAYKQEAYALEQSGQELPP